MNRKCCNPMLLLCATALTLCLFQPRAAIGEFRAAIAIRDVTPDPLLPVSGGVGPTHPVNRKIGKLTVRALTLENDGTRVTI
jgi:hypothetical protein